LHFQLEHPQGKLIRTIVGEILDVLVDLRQSSPTFGKWETLALSAANQRMLWIPPGFAHGFRVLSAEAHVLYKATDFYFPQHERTLLWNDKDLGIDWKIMDEPIISAKDQSGITFREISKFP
jgi:dTDP-4-dehydrorhamnose 3,5-epimerase